MGKHTQEPWKVCHWKDDRRGFEIADRNQNRVGFDMTEANARRIVACVNACRGLPTDELEHKGLVAAVGTQLLDLDESLTQSRAHASAYKDRYAKEASRSHDLEQLRDELLAALTLSLEQMECDAVFIDGEYSSSRDLDELEQDGDLPNAILVARAAIAKAKGGAA